MPDELELRAPWRRCSCPGQERKSRESEGEMESIGKEKQRDEGEAWSGCWSLVAAPVPDD